MVGRRWTEEELNRLKVEFPTTNLEDFSKSMNRTIRAIQHKTFELGIKRVFWQYGDKNPAWVDGHANHYYRRIAFDFYPKLCGFCGKTFKKDDLDVHHKDRNPTNNKITNLLIVCKPCHRVIHNYGVGYPRENFIKKTF